MIVKLNSSAEKPEYRYAAKAERATHRYIYRVINSFASYDPQVVRTCDFRIEACTCFNIN